MDLGLGGEGCSLGEWVYRWWMPAAPFLASSHWGRDRRFQGRKEGFGSPTRSYIAGVENMRHEFHIGTTSHLGKVHSPQPGHRARPSWSLSHEPMLSLRTLRSSQLIPVNPLGLQESTHVALLPWRLTQGFLAEKSCLSSFRAQGDVGWGWLGALGVMMNLGLLGVIVLLERPVGTQRMCME